MSEALKHKLIIDVNIGSMASGFIENAQGRRYQNVPAEVYECKCSVLLEVYECKCTNRSVLTEVY